MDMNNEKDLKKEAPLAQDHDDMKLDDARRVKVLSPGMLVFKRFIRNKLAVVGIIILVFMFVFAFIGPLFSPPPSSMRLKRPATKALPSWTSPVPI